MTPLPLPLPLGEVPQISDLGRRGFVFPSQSKIKDFCQLSLRESQEGCGGKRRDKPQFENLQNRYDFHLFYVIMGKIGLVSPFLKLQPDEV